MKTIIKPARTLAIAFTVIASFAAAANTELFRTVSSFDGPGTNRSWAFGTTFTVSSTDIAISALGAYDFGSDGFSTGGGIKVGIYQVSTNSLLISTNVLSSDPIAGSYRYANVSINLAANTQYRLVAVSGSDNYIQGAGTWSYNTNGLNFNGFSYSSNTELTSLGTNFESDYGMGNFQYTVIPEPSVTILFGIGIVGLVTRRFRGKKEN